MTFSPGGKPLRRVPHWDVRLTQWASSRIGRPFVWGEMDCTLLAIEALDALCGTSLADGWRGRYGTAEEALAIQLREDIDLRRGLLRQGCTPVPVGFRQRGDIILARQDHFWCAHVSFGERLLSCNPEQGVIWCRTSEADPALLALRAG